MTHSGGKLHINVGDKGQRYELSVLDSAAGYDERVVICWGDNLDRMEVLAQSVVKRPSWSDAEILDRGESV